MRVIAGKHKKANLFSVPGKTSRPTTDYLKEVIFSVIYNCEDKEVLDLYSGSGSLAIEALSRGAHFAVMVDASEKAIKTICMNVNKLKLDKDCRINKKRVSPFLKNCEDKFDLILLDPPYNKNLVNPTLDAIFENDIIKEDGLVVIEHAREEKISEKWSKFRSYEKISGISRITILHYTTED